MDEHTMEKSTVDRADYEGLQLDTRIIEGLDKDLDISPRRQDLSEYSDEKTPVTPVMRTQLRRLGELPAADSMDSSSHPMKPIQMDDSLPNRQPQIQRIFGLRRKMFWLALGLILAIIVVAAVIGGVLGGLRQSGGNDETVPPASANPGNSSSSQDSSEPLPESDVMAGSPLALVSFTSNRTGGTDPSSQNAFRLYFQSAHGNVKEARNDGGVASWQAATPILTDARNNSGLAVMNYMNGSQEQTTIIYVGASNGNLQEKRNLGSQYDWTYPNWPGSINELGLKATGNISAPYNDGLDDPESGWDSYRMTATYSTNFHDGPSGRLFYHSQGDNGTAWVQELIWNQNADKWTEGSIFTDPWPTSHLAATVDEKSRMLRLFFSAGNLTLQECWLNISDPNAQYRTGVRIPNLLAHDDADLAAVSVDGDTLVYHYAEIGVLSIRELNTSGSPGFPNSQESYNLSQSIVAQPALVTKAGVSLYQPIGATVSNTTGPSQQIYVFYADHNENITSGYGQLNSVSRTAGNMTWPASSFGQSQGQVVLNLGDDNTNPSQ